MPKTSGKLKPIKYRDYTIEIIKNSPSTFMYNINNSGWVILYAPNKEHVLKRVKREVDWLLKYTPIAARVDWSRRKIENVWASLPYDMRRGKTTNEWLKLKRIGNWW